MAIKELRYGFKIFAPFKDVPKVTFGASSMHHFETAVADGDIRTTYRQEDGWAASSGIDIAAGKGLPDTVVRCAREIIKL